MVGVEGLYSNYRVTRSSSVIYYHSRCGIIVSQPKSRSGVYTGRCEMAVLVIGSHCVVLVCTRVWVEWLY